MVYHLDDNGTMAVVLPHGVLFRGAAEGTIRKYLIEEKNYLDAVIGLPANLFFGTSIPTSILVFKKCREAYRNRETIDKFSYVASLDEIKDNDYNLNIPRYVDTFKEEEPIDLDVVQQQLSDIDKEITNVESEINDYLKELGVLKHG